MEPTEKRYEYVCGIKCSVEKVKFPDGKCLNCYTFTVPGWEQCTVTGIRAAKKVINARLDLAVRRWYGIND